VENFGPVLMSVTSCMSCAYRHTDVVSLTAHEPTATAMKVLSTEDLKVRVIRGGTATILVPELGVSIQPGLNNEGFISNVEGVLTRIEDVTRFLADSLKGHRHGRARSVLTKIERARGGKLRFTLVLKDPFGNSTIVSHKTKRRKISGRELSNLKFGAHALAARK